MLGLKLLIVTYTLAYYDTELITAIKIYSKGAREVQKG
jgi:hypothetical protein